MSHLKRTVAALGVPALLALSLSACGSSSGSSAPKDASTSAFCANFSGTNDSSDFKDTLKKVKDTGTPSDMPDDARKGFELIVDKASDAGSEKNLENIDPSDFSSSEQKELQAFVTYIGTKCNPLGDSSSGTPSDTAS